MFLHRLKTSLANWSLRNAEGPYAKRWLALLSFSEASFFPIPPDILLMAILLARQDKKWKHYSFIVVLWSVLGGAFGYFIGMFLYDVIGIFLINTYNLEQYSSVVKSMFAQNAFWSVFLAGFTPIPYKVFTISAGFFDINFFVFIIASILSRALRFFSVGYIMKVFGRDIGKFVFKYFNTITIFFAIIVIGAIIVFSF